MYTLCCVTVHTEHWITLVCMLCDCTHRTVFNTCMYAVWLCRLNTVHLYGCNVRDTAGLKRYNRFLKIEMWTDLWQAPPTCPVPSCHEPVILSPVQWRHARSLSFSHLSSAVMPAACHSPTVQCRHARSLSFSHLSSAVMPAACHSLTCPVLSCQRWSFQRWNSGQQMSLITLRRLRGQHRWTLVTEGRGGFLFLFFSPSCALSQCVGCFVFTLFQDALWTGKRGACGCQGFVTWRLSCQILGTWQWLHQGLGTCLWLEDLGTCLWLQDLGTWLWLQDLGTWLWIQDLGTWQWQCQGLATRQHLATSRPWDLTVDLLRPRRNVHVWHWAPVWPH